MNLTHLFPVDKADGDICLVYDCTRSLVNDALWAPSFALPTIEAVLQAMESDTWGADVDLGKMFLNFMLHESLQAFCGVDMTPFFPEELKDGCKALWEWWTWCLMGLTISPYQTIRAILLVEEVICSDRQDTLNPFQWE